MCVASHDKKTEHTDADNSTAQKITPPTRKKRTLKQLSKRAKDLLKRTIFTKQRRREIGKKEETAAGSQKERTRKKQRRKKKEQEEDKRKKKE